MRKLVMLCSGVLKDRRPFDCAPCGMRRDTSAPFRARPTGLRKFRKNMRPHDVACKRLQPESVRSKMLVSKGFGACQAGSSALLLTGLLEVRVLLGELPSDGVSESQSASTSC